MKHFRLSKRIIAFLFCSLAAGSGYAVTIDFTGYADGNLADDAAWDGQNGNQVLDSKVVLSSGSSFQRNWLVNPLDAGAVGYTIGGTVSFSRTDQDTLASVQGIVSFDLRSEAAIGPERFTVRLQRNGADASQYRLGFFENSPTSATTTISGDWLEESLLGFGDAADTESDLLSMELVLNRGADETDWTMQANLYNLDSGSPNDPISSLITQTAFSTELSLFEDPLYAFINSVNDESGSSTFDRTVHSFTAVAIPEPSTVGLLLSACVALTVMVRRRR